MRETVRGWTDASELQDLEEGVYAHVCHDKTDATLYHPFPVLVVPIDDASVEAMAARMVSAYEDATNGDRLPDGDGADVAITTAMIRAALGIGGGGA